MQSLKSTVRSHPALNEARRAIRFFQRVPARDLLRPDRVALAARVRPFTLLSYPRLAAIHELAEGLERDGIRGAFAELGVCNGGSAAVMAHAARRNASRHVWLFDSWEGLPEPEDVDVSVTGHRRPKGWDLGSEDRVREVVFRRLRLDPARIHLVKGWFEETVPRVREDVGPLALMHLDGDWYASIRFCLEQLYDRVVPGGVVVIDDYGHWLGCRKAVDEFFAGRGETPRFHQVDGNSVYLRKP